MNASDTIAAIASPMGRGGLGIVRLSGPESCAVTCALLRFATAAGPRWNSWSSQRAALLDATGQVVDQVVVSFFAAPRSYTGQDVVEITCHGAPVVLRLCLERAVAAGARLAEPGEFTLRAYLSGRIDLPQAEAVRELIDATTLFQARVASQQMDGSVSRRIRPLKEQLVEMIALLEAGIDFAEDDVSVAADGELYRRLDLLEDEMKRLLFSFDAGRFVFGGFTLAIAGRPNVGKSSLFNRLLEQERAIVTPIAGTTRDLVSEQMAIGGIPVRLMDTAGIRDSDDEVEMLGIERSYQAVADADLTLLVIDASTPMSDEDRALAQSMVDRRPLLVANKCDLGDALGATVVAVRVSAVTGEGLGELKDAVLRQLAPGGLVAPEDGSITSIRHEGLLRESAEALQHARKAVDFHIPHEMLLLDLYAALQPIDAITGATTADDILNRIFSTFCIGK